MLGWSPRTRLKRLTEAAERLAAERRRWQQAIRIDPARYERRHGEAAGHPIVRVALLPEDREAWRRLAELLGGMAGLRAVAYLPEAHREQVTLHPWTDGLDLPPQRWGGPLANYRPDGVSAAPVDDALWHQVTEDPRFGDARRRFETLGAHLRSANEPLAPLAALALPRAAEVTVPEGWSSPPVWPVRLLWHEALAALWRGFLGEGPEAILLAEALAATLAPAAPELPEAVNERLTGSWRVWKERGTPFGRALDGWQEELMELPNELLERHWHQALRDEAVTALLRAAATSDKTVEFREAGLWEVGAAFTTSGPLWQALTRLDPGAASRIEHLYKEEGGRFKAKVRRRRAARHLAELALVAGFERWGGELVAESWNRLELGPEEPARAHEEAQRGALYLLSTEHVTGTGQAVAATFATGHLFADMQGFTALTERLAEVEIREFLRQNFYVPLLDLAKGLFKGGIDLADRGGVRLNNLLGDAISLCGEVTDLLAFAERAMDLVRNELAAAVRTAQAERYQRLREERADLERRLGSATETERTELERALAQIDAELEPIVFDFGCFVAYGPAPIDLVWEDDLFGRLHVALAAKINESARGVARDGGLARILQRLAREARKPIAFEVHVGPRIVGELPEELLDAWPTDPEESAVVAEALRGRISFTGGTTLHNRGVGLSTEAVRNLVGERDALSIWSGRREELPLTIRDRCVVVEPHQTFLWLAEGPDGGPRILRRCGRVEMKGFRRPPLVWEWIGPWQPLYDALVEWLPHAVSEHPTAELLPD